LKSYTIRKYQSSDYSLWNEFVANAKNATFLFHRDFMEYHQDRFEDFSLLVFDEKNLLKAILPANRVGDNLYSHQGLTYGGLVINASTMLFEVIQINQVILSFLYEQQILKLYLKIIPTIYNNIPSDEMEYISFLLHAKLYRRDAIAILDITNQVEKSRVRKRGIEKGLKNNLVIKEVDDFEIFWNQLLIPNLKERYNVSPVHTLEEIKYLKLKFPSNIRQFNVYLKDELVAGTTIFESEFVAHSQYISGNSNKNELGSLDFLHNTLINHTFKDKKYFDFGISNENQGKNVNAGLLYWKESFGARTIVQNFYEIETKNHTLLENVLI
jgi:hypothetical protein